MLAVALPISRALLARKPSPPPATAPFDQQRRYWRDRIKADLSDKDAYLQLGILEERQGFYLSARRNLESAHALGVPDARVIGPLGRTFNQLGLLDLAETNLTKAVTLAPDSLEATLNLAGFFVTARQSRRADEAISAFWTRRGSTLTAAEKVRVALAFLESNDLKLAREAAESALKSEPGNMTAAMTAARCAFSLGDAPAARKFVEAALKGDPTAAPAQYFYGLVLRKSGDSDGALRAFQEANKLDPALTDVYERIAEEYAKRKNFKKAAYAMDRFAMNTKTLGGMVRAAEAYRAAKMPEDAAYWDAAATGIQGDYVTALQRGKVAANSTNPAVRRRGLSAIAEAYRGMDRKKEYLATLLEATKARTADDLQALAIGYESLNRYDKYIECLREIIVKDPTREAVTRYQLAITLSKTGQSEQATKDLERAVALDPKNATYLLELAALYLKTSGVGDNLAKATKLSQQATELAPNQEESWRTLGQCYAASDQLALAAQCLEHAIDLEAGRGPTYLELSRVYARMGNADGSKAMVALYQKYVAFEQQRMTIELRAKRKEATVADLTAYGDLKLNLGESSETVKAYERAHTLAPKDASVKAMLTQLYQRLNLPDRLAKLQEEK